MGQTTSAAVPERVDNNNSSNSRRELSFVVTAVCRDRRFSSSFSLSDVAAFSRSMTEINRMRTVEGHSRRITLEVFDVSFDTSIGEVRRTKLEHVFLTSQQIDDLKNLSRNTPRQIRTQYVVGVKLCVLASFGPSSDALTRTCAGLVHEIATNMKFTVHVEQNNHVSREAAARINDMLKINRIWFDPETYRVPGEGESDGFFMWPRHQADMNNERQPFVMEVTPAAPSFVEFHPMKVDATAVPFGDGRILVCGGSFNEHAQVDPPHYSFFYTSVMNRVNDEYDIQIDMVHIAAVCNPYEERVYLAGFDRSDDVMKVVAIQTWDKQQFSLTKYPLDSRSGHTVAFVDGVTMMIAGGEGMHNSHWTDSRRTQLVDVTTGVVREGPRMLFPRVNHTMTKLKNGNLFVVGGTRSPTTSEIYDVVTGKFVRGPDLNSPRELHVACLGHQGLVLILGGLRNSRTACLYNPYTNELKRDHPWLHDIDIVDYDAVPVE